MKISSFSILARVTLAALFFVSGVALALLALFTTTMRSASPASATLGPAGPTLNWVGTATGGASLDESTILLRLKLRMASVFCVSCLGNTANRFH